MRCSVSKKPKGHSAFPPLNTIEIRIGIHLLARPEPDSEPMRDMEFFKSYLGLRRWPRDGPEKGADLPRRNAREKQEIAVRPTVKAQVLSKPLSVNGRKS
jgi:hypothetical protein